MTNLAVTCYLARVLETTALALLIACGSTAETTAPTPPKVEAKPAPAPEVKEAAGAPLAEDNPFMAPSAVDEVLQQAFGKDMPDLPQLSRDGNTVAFHAGVPYGQSGGSSYVLSFVSLEPRAMLGRFVVIDDELTKELMEAKAAERKPKLDLAEVTRQAKRVVAHLAEGGYSKFEGRVDEIGVPDLAEVGAYKVQTTQSDDGVLTLAIHEGGKQIGTAKIEPLSTGSVGDEPCLWRPVPEAAWFDTARRRVLVEVGWRDAVHDCGEPAETYRLFKSR